VEIANKENADMVIADEIRALKELVKQQDAAAVYSRGLALGTEFPQHEYLSYATAWAAARLGKNQECLELLAPALALKPEQFAYLSLRANACLALQRYAEAQADFLKLSALKPEVPSLWKTLLRIRKESGLNVELPRNLVIVADEMAQAYRTRKWEQCTALLAELQALEPLTWHYWKLLTDDFLSRLMQPVSAWKEFYEFAAARLSDMDEPVSPLVDRNIPYLAFCNYFSALIKIGEADIVIAAMRQFAALFQRPCPARYGPAVCALLIREKRYAECLEIDAAIEAGLSDEAARKEYRLQAYPSKWACRRAQAEAAGESDPASSNALSDSLFDELQAAVSRDTPPGRVLELAFQCWDAIRALDGMRLLDLRFDQRQLAILKARIQAALEQRQPLSLLRLGDGEAYGFGTGPDSPCADAMSDIVETVETVWWGRRLPAEVRNALADGFQASLASADVIGLPGALRLTRDLPLAQEAPRPESLLECKYRVLFEGINGLLERRVFNTATSWVDEFCNLMLADHTYLAGLIERARAVVVVGCFDIPTGHLFDHAKIVQVPVPPVSKMKALGTRQFGAAILPEVIDEVRASVLCHAAPGVLILISAGFAGKTLLGSARAAGAVAIDFGSALDALMGYQTRSLELAAQATTQGPRDQAVEIAGIPVVAPAPVVRIKLEDINPNGRLPLFFQDRARLGCVTSVKLLDEKTLICCNLVGRRIYLIEFDAVTGHSRVLDSRATVFEGESVETDLCDADREGRVLTTAFYKGSATLYQREGSRLHHVRDLPFKLDGYAHGVKFYRPGIAAVAIAKGAMGIYFYDLDRCTCLLHVDTGMKVQDLCFVSDHRFVAVLGYGSPSPQAAAPSYDSALCLYEFNLAERTYAMVKRAVYVDIHLDSCVRDGVGNLYINNQFNDQVCIVDEHTLQPARAVAGFDFPHGLDVRFGLLASSNYGSNEVLLHQLATLQAVQEGAPASATVQLV
jgi:tetratricopeptide (TPR) repeat protein